MKEEEVAIANSRTEACVSCVLPALVSKLLPEDVIATRLTTFKTFMTPFPLQNILSSGLALPHPGGKDSISSAEATTRKGGKSMAEMIGLVIVAGSILVTFHFIGAFF